MQLTPDRSAMVTADPHYPRTLRITVSGVAPRGPQATVHVEPAPSSLSPRPTRIRVRVQQLDSTIRSDLAWADAPQTVAQVKADFDGPVSAQSDLTLWAGSVTFSKSASAEKFRLLIQEDEFISAGYALVDGKEIKQPSRMIYAETFELDQISANLV